MRRETNGTNPRVWGSIAVLAMALVGCDEQEFEFSAQVDSPISGLAAGDYAESGEIYDYNTLAVFDEKNKPGDENKPRFAIVERHGSNASVVPIDQSQVSWPPEQKRGNDIEAICQLNETYYLAAESSFYKGDYGRLFLLEREPSQGGLSAGLRLVATYSQSSSPDELDGISFEGLACAPSNDNDDSYNILLGDRNSGGLYWENIHPLQDIAATGVIPLAIKKVGVITAPSSWSTSRDISDLYFSSSSHRLFGVASYDPEDKALDSKQNAQPHSMMYRTSHSFHLEDMAFMQSMASSGGNESLLIEPVHSFPNHKVEGITAFGATDGMFYGSDDDTTINEYGLVSVE
ncbi:hypothetical protein [Vibrio coralliilyticus]|uniref:hypothetical protein n=1 Tax=Vibrio coralliilyticus TaxID=190893 RepID=UPI000C162CE0|nr:hypothetical protein [Vibrio coralliilyticus]